jgi:Flp pilus assembly protein TadD
MAVAGAAFALACGEGAEHDAARASYERANALARAGQLEPAARELASALEHDPRSVQALLLQGAVLERLDRLDEAERSYAEAARIAPAHPDPPLHLARVARLRALDGQIAEARRALDAASDPGPAHRALGDLLLERRRAEPAQRQYQLALRHDPDDAAAHSGLAVVLVGVRREVRGLYHASEALRLQPDDRRALGELVWVLATSSEPTLRDPAEAIRRAEATEEGTRPPRLLDGLAAAYAAVGRRDEAIATATAAIEGAEGTERHALARAIASRRALYERGGRYVGPPVDPG